MTPKLAPPSDRFEWTFESIALPHVSSPDCLKRCILVGKPRTRDRVPFPWKKTQNKSDCPLCTTHLSVLFPDLFLGRATVTLQGNMVVEQTKMRLRVHLYRVSSKLKGDIHNGYRLKLYKSHGTVFFELGDVMLWKDEKHMIATAFSSVSYVVPFSDHHRPRASFKVLSLPIQISSLQLPFRSFLCPAKRAITSKATTT
jgi:hypothetical protein